MKKLLFVVVCLLAVLLALAPAALAASRAEVSGEWTWENTGGYEKLVPVDHGLLPAVGAVGTGTEIGEWTGSFEGVSDDVFHYVFTPQGTFIGTLVSYITGSVNGVSGTFTVRVTFFYDPATEIMSGHWNICAAGGDLRGLRGTGTWWVGPEFPAYYSGTILTK